jgi:hypothetical protein
MTTYTNPRMNATIVDWPLGRTQRCTATFTIEQHPTRGERAVRTTIGKPKALTYAVKARIVDGDDGRTYIAELTSFGFVSIMKGDMKFQHESIFDRDPRYAEVRALFEVAA